MDHTTSVCDPNVANSYKEFVREFILSNTNSGHYFTIHVLSVIIILSSSTTSNCTSINPILSAALSKGYRAYSIDSTCSILLHTCAYSMTLVPAGVPNRNMVTLVIIKALNVAIVYDSLLPFIWGDSPPYVTTGIQYGYLGSL